LAGPAQGIGDIGPRLGWHFSWTIFMNKKKIFDKIFTRKGRQKLIFAYVCLNTLAGPDHWVLYNFITILGF
jgi:hypothetical protein